MSEETDWVKKVEEEREKIKKWQTTDRLSMVSKLMFMNGSVASSVTGWHSWLTNASVMEQLSEEQLRELVDEFEKIAVAFLDLDIKYTKLVQKKMETEEGKKKSKKTSAYVA